MKCVTALALVFLAQTLTAQTIQIDCGYATSNYVAADGTTWVTDEYSTGGDGLYTGSEVLGTPDSTLYRTARYGLYSNFGYKIPVANGSYAVTLKFAEIKYSAAGQRVFNVTVNGAPVLTNFDILAHTAPNTALDETFPVTVSNSLIDIEFVGVVNLGIINAIQVKPAVAAPVLTMSPGSLSFSGAVGTTIASQTLNIGSSGSAMNWSVSGVPSWLTLTNNGQTPSVITVTPNPASFTAAGTWNATLLFSAAGASNSPVSVPVSLTLTAAASSGTSTFQIDSGFRTTSYTGSDGTVWQTDDYFNSGDGLYTGSAINGTTDPALYQTARYGLYSNFSYQFPVSNGTYYVTLKFAEIKYSAAGQRVFNVTINGTPVLTNFDILAHTAPFTALDETFPVTVSGNQINIQFIGVVNMGIVNAIKISGTAPSAPAPPPTLSISAPATSVTSGQSLQFTAAESGSSTVPAVTWSAAQGSISSAGLFTPPAVSTSTSIIISAQTMSVPALEAQTTVTVNPAAAPAPPPPGQPVLSVTPGSLSYAGTVGGTLTAQSLSIKNSTGAAMSWSATASPSWLTLSAPSGSMPATLTVTANASGFAAGTSTGSVTITAAGATGSPLTIPVTVTLTAAGGSQFYVSPTGSSSGNGSISRPWDLQTALNGPASVTPGSTIWLLGGTYGDSTVTYNAYLTGTAAAPIIVRGYPGQRATVDGSISTYSPYVWYWGFEIMSSQTDRSSGALRLECIDTYPNSTGVKIINMVLHDCLQGIGFWVGAIGGEANGNLIYYNGETGTPRGVGHGIYTQNQCPQTRTINDNIIFDSFDINFQGYGSGAAFVQCYALDGNVSFNAGAPMGVHVDNIIFAVGSGLDQIDVADSYTYHTPSANAGYSRLGWVFGTNNNGTLTATNNYWIGGGGGEASIEMWGWNNINYQGNTSYSTGGTMMELQPGADGTKNYTIDNNQYYGSGLMDLSGNLGGLGEFQADGMETHSKYSAAPTGTWTFVRPNKYEAGRANVIIYNWGLLPSIPVNLSTVLNPGDPYVIRDSENYYGTPLASGTYTGAPISIPMTGLTKALPVGYQAIPHTAPQFGVFIVSHQ